MLRLRAALIAAALAVLIAAPAPSGAIEPPPLSLLTERFLALAANDDATFGNTRPKRFSRRLTLYHSETDDQALLEPLGDALLYVIDRAGLIVRYGPDPNFLVHFVDRDSAPAVERAYRAYPDPKVRATFDAARASPTYPDGLCFFTPEIDAHFSTILRAHLFVSSALAEREPSGLLAACIEEELVQALGLFDDADWPESGFDNGRAPLSAADGLFLATLYDPALDLDAEPDALRRQIADAMCAQAAEASFAIGGCEAEDPAQNGAPASMQR